MALSLVGKIDLAFEIKPFRSLVRCENADFRPNFLLPFQQKKPNQDQYFGGRKGNTSRDSDMDML